MKIIALALFLTVSACKDKVFDKTIVLQNQIQHLECSVECYWRVCLVECLDGFKMSYWD